MLENITPAQEIQQFPLPASTEWTSQFKILCI